MTPRTRLSIAIGAPLLFAAVGWGWWRGVETTRASSREVADLLARKARIEQVNAELRREVTALSREREARARAARNILDAAGPGEVVIVVPATPSPRR